MERSPEQYLDSLYEEDLDLTRVEQTLSRLGMPAISVAPGYGRLLTWLVALIGAKEVLEIGALGGYSGICLARGLAGGGRLTSLELRGDYAEAARTNVEEAGFAGMAEYIVGDASSSLERLHADGRKFDFFFIDADKENYPVYLEWALKLGNAGAIIAADNTLLRGRTVDPAKQGPSVLAVREFNRLIAQDPRLSGVHLPAYDGLALARIL